MKVLMIEDDAETADIVCDGLSKHGYEISVCFTGPDGLDVARVGGYHALIVDRMLPGLDGLSLVKCLRDEGNHVPVLFVTAMSEVDDRVAGLDGGADDYLCKPFALCELAARLNAITRRGSSGEQVLMRVEDLEVDLIRRTVKRAGNQITLQPVEFDLLAYLTRNFGNPVTKSMLRENVWNLHFDPGTNIIETHMSRLRCKMDRGFGVELIKTIRGSGYIMSAKP